MTTDQDRLIQEFALLLRTIPDDRSGIHPAVDFLGSAMRIRQFVPPVTEFVTVLKKNKPVLFRYLKKAIAPTSPLFFILQLDMDYETALQRLNLADDRDMFA